MGRFLLITTGGTIASTAEKGGFAAGLNGAELLKTLPPVPEAEELTLFDLFCIPSPQIGPAQWLELAQCIASRGADFDGVAVLHGTDTMAYTAAALSFLLLDFQKPVVLTGAMRAPSEENADGPKNISDALRTLDALARHGHSGVWLTFGGRILCASCLKKRSWRSMQGFETPALPLMGSVSANGAVLDASALERMKRRIPQGFCLKRELNPRVMGLVIHPGLTREMLLNALNMADAFVLESYGSGGGPAEGNCEILSFLDAAREGGKPVVNVTPCAKDGMRLTRYHNGVRAAERGMISGGAMTFEAALVKTMWLLPRVAPIEEFARAMTRSFCGECAEERR